MPFVTQFDRDGDGKITKTELAQLLDAVGYTLTWNHDRERMVPEQSRGVLERASVFLVDSSGGAGQH